ncbi:hypothetical protein ACFLZP_02460 [Patescibacteria group bacterium]
MTAESGYRKYSPSAERVIPEEADDPRVRANADSFVGQMLIQMDRAEYGLRALVPTPQTVLERYQEVAASYSPPYEEGLFNLGDAYGATRRRLLFELDLAAENFRQRSVVNPLEMEHIGNLYMLITAIELTFPPTP